MVRREFMYDCLAICKDFILFKSNWETLKVEKIVSINQSGLQIEFRVVQK